MATGTPRAASRAVLNGKKKSVPEPVFPKKPAGTPCAQPWLVAVGGWRLAVGGWQLATGGLWRLVVVGGGWWLVIGGWWRLAVDGSWRLVVGGPLGWSLRAVLSKKKKSGPLRTALAVSAIHYTALKSRTMAHDGTGGTLGCPFAEAKCWLSASNIGRGGGGGGGGATPVLRRCTAVLIHPRGQCPSAHTCGR